MMNIDFIGKRKVYYTISLALIAIGILVSLILGVKMDIQFKGGTIIKYTFAGSVEKNKANYLDEKKASEIASKTLGSQTSVQIENAGEKDQRIVFTLDKKSISSTDQQKLETALISQFKTNNLKYYYKNTVSPLMGAQFLQKSIFAVILASLLIILYIWIRFRKIGGLPAGLTAFASLLHDVIMAFVAFSIFRIALNDNFIAVALTILGYSINDTIVVYDRIRENRKIYGLKMTFKDIVNKSINQTFSRTINTVMVTFVAIAVICVFAIINNLESIRSFALPMMVGVATGAYSTICIAGPLWVTWEDYKTDKELKLKALKTAKVKAR